VAAVERWQQWQHILTAYVVAKHGIGVKHILGYVYRYVIPLQTVEGNQTCTAASSAVVRQPWQSTIHDTLKLMTT
jgi:hypothetical protein